MRGNISVRFDVCMLYRVTINSFRNRPLQVGFDGLGIAVDTAHTVCSTKNDLNLSVNLPVMIISTLSDGIRTSLVRSSKLSGWRVFNSMTSTSTFLVDSCAFDSHSNITRPKSQWKNVSFHFNFDFYFILFNDHNFYIFFNKIND